MSDGKEVKRWFSSHPGPTREMVEIVLASDHDRKTNEYEVLLNRKFEQLCEKDSVIAELRAEVEELKRHKAKYEADCKRIEYFDELHEKVARQARVIEIATRSMATVLELEHCGETSCPFPMRAMCSNESHKVLRSALKELAAIERAEGEKE